MREQQQVDLYIINRKLQIIPCCKAVFVLRNKKLAVLAYTRMIHNNKDIFSLFRSFTDELHFVEGGALVLGNDFTHIVTYLVHKLAFGWR